VRLTKDGSIIWEKTYGGSSTEFANEIIRTSDYGYAIAGYTYSNDGDVTENNGLTDYWIIKIDSSGNLQWQQSYGGTNLDYAYAIRQMDDGGYLIGGKTSSSDGDVIGSHGSSDYWVIKLDTAGNLVWQKCFGGTSIDHLFAMEQTEGGVIILSGYSYSNDGDITENKGNSDYWIAAIDETGNLLWEQSYGGREYDKASGMANTLDGGVIVAGSAESIDGDVTGNHGISEDYWIVKLSCVVSQIFYSDGDGDGYGTSSGSIMVYSCLPPPGYAFDTIDCNDGNASINPGAVEIPGNGIDDNCDGEIDEATMVTYLQNSAYTDFITYPNPNNGEFVIELKSKSLLFGEARIKLLNILGQPVYETTHVFDNRSSQFMIQTREITAGLYFLQIAVGGKIFMSQVSCQTQ
jgi:hypothetical protein